MAVAEIGDSDAAAEVKILLAVLAVNIRTLGALSDHGRQLTGVTARVKNGVRQLLEYTLTLP
jgi:hypothetical protein